MVFFNRLVFTAIALLLVVTFAGEQHQGLRAQQLEFPGIDWLQSTPAAAGLDSQQLEQAKNYALQGGGSGLIIRGGKQVYAWGNTSQRFEIKSSTKSIGVLALGLAIHDSLLELDAAASLDHFEFGQPPAGNQAWLDSISYRQLCAQNAGFGESGGYEPLLFEPGNQWFYSNCGPNWMAESLTLLYGQDMHALLNQRIFNPIQLDPNELQWRTNIYRDELINGIPRKEFGSGISASADALARIAYLLLRNGNWQGQQLLDLDFLFELQHSQHPGLDSHSPLGFENAANHYGLLWWNNRDGTLVNVPRDAFWSWGLFESLMVVIPSLDLVITRVGPNGFRSGWDADYSVLAPFLDPICLSAMASSPTSKNDEFSSLVWDEGFEDLGMNNESWVLSQKADGDYLAAFSQGQGLEAADLCMGQSYYQSPSTLALGYSKLTISQMTASCGLNFSSPTGERMGSQYASSLLCVDGQSYMWMNELGFTRLYSSPDYGLNWNLALVDFVTTLGQASFVQAGAGYQGSESDWVYIVGQNAPIDLPTSSLVMARVNKFELEQASSYQYFAGLDPQSQPIWSSQISARQPVFSDPFRCQHSSMLYVESLDQYFLWQAFPTLDLNTAGGFALYVSPNAYGPFENIFISELWDVGPGSKAQLLSVEDFGASLRLRMAFSSEDKLRIREGTLTRHQKIAFTGDLNADEEVNIADVIMLLGYLFNGTTPLQIESSDVNQDGLVDIADAIRLLNNLFGAG